VDLVRQGRMVHQRILTWVVNKVSRTVLKTGVVGIAYVVTGQFIISAAAMMLLVFMTDFAKVALASDRARGSPAPSSWRMGPWIKIAFVLGLVMLAEALAALAWGWEQWNLAHHPRQLRTFSFALLLDFALLSLVSIREHGPFWRSAPSRLLASVLLLDWALGMTVVTIGLESIVPLPWWEMLSVLGWSLLCCLGVNDALKVLLIRRWLEPRAGGARGLQGRRQGAA
jgi:H+-transporting ATPase